MIRKLALMATLLIGLIAVAAAVLPRTPAPAGARLYIIEPQEGAVVASPVTVRFGLSGMGVAPAGVEKEATGHHHLLIDVAQMPALDQPLPATDHIVHFGGGQTEATIELAAGQHTLQLVLGDMSHVPHEPPVISAKIIITVE
jgi:hypothetical protein